jgi:hypothetical protein
MEIKELNKRIDALGKLNLTVETEIQDLGLVCMAHCEQHGDTMPMNRLVNVLRRTQFQAFGEWAMAFGKFKRNADKVTKESQPLAYDKTRTTDIEGATAKQWFMFADAKPEAIAKAFDFQGAMMALIKKAAANGVDHAKLLQAATIAGIKPEKVPATVITVVAPVVEPEVTPNV